MPTASSVSSAASDATGESMEVDVKFGNPIYEDDDGRGGERSKRSSASAKRGASPTIMQQGTSFEISRPSQSRRGNSSPRSSGKQKKQDRDRERQEHKQQKKGVKAEHEPKVPPKGMSDQAKSFFESLSSGVADAAKTVGDSLASIYGDKSSELSRQELASKTFKQIFRVLDSNKDHSVSATEFSEGLDVVQRSWVEIQRLYICSKQDLARSHLLPPAQQHLYSQMQLQSSGLDQKELFSRARELNAKQQDLLIDRFEIIEKLIDKQGGLQATINQMSTMTVLQLKRRAVDAGVPSHLYTEGEREICEDTWRKRLMRLTAHRELSNQTKRLSKKAAESAVRTKLQRIVREHRAAIGETDTIPDDLDELAICVAHIEHVQDRPVRHDELDGLDDTALYDLVTNSRDANVRKEAAGSKILTHEKLVELALSSETVQHKTAEVKADIKRLTLEKLHEQAVKMGIAETELWKTKEELQTLILEKTLEDMVPATEITDTLLSCALVVCKETAGKIPNTVDPVLEVRKILDDDGGVVRKMRDILRQRKGSTWDISAQNEMDEMEESALPQKFKLEEEAAVEWTEEGLHPDYHRLLCLLCDPYLVHIVIPQLEAWQTLFNIFDLKRTGNVIFSELEHGLATSCSPEIDLVQTTSTVQNLVDSMKFVLRENRLVKVVTDLVTNVFNEENGEFTISEVQRMRSSNPKAMRYLREEFTGLYSVFIGHVKRVADAVTTRDDLQNIDSHIYGLRYASLSLIKALRTAIPQLHHRPILEEQLLRVRTALNGTIIKTCTLVMTCHAMIYGRTSTKMHVAATAVLKRYFSTYIMRRRVQMFARVNAWGQTRRQKSRSRGRTKVGVLVDSPLVKFQARCRGVASRVRIRKMGEKAMGKRPVAELVFRDELFVIHENTDFLGYFEWPKVLINYLHCSKQHLSLHSAVAEVLKRLKAEQSAAHEEEHGFNLSFLLGEDSDDDEEKDDTGIVSWQSTGPAFPEILMDRAGLKQKFNFLRNSLHTWHELLMMLDSDSSGSLSVGELRTSLMAFSEMGLITEEVELQPLSGAYEEFKEKIYRYPKYHKELSGKIGWDESLYGGYPRADGTMGRKHTYWMGRQPYLIDDPFEKQDHPSFANTPIKNFPIYTHPGTVLLLGVKGVPCSHHPWALSVEFQFDERDPDAFIGSRKYSVLCASYANQAIVVRNSGNINQPGIQLLTIKSEAFDNPARLLEVIEKEEHQGLDGPKGIFPNGKGTYALTPFIPMEQLRWYRLVIQGQQTDTAAGSRHQKLVHLSIRLDPLCFKTSEPLGPDDDGYEILQYHNGDIQINETTKVKWAAGAKELKPHHEVEMCLEQIEHTHHAQREAKKHARSGGKNTANADRPPWFHSTWIGLVAMKDFYSLGNVYNNLCSDASDTVEWSIGALRNFRLYKLDKVWLKQRVKTWPNYANYDHPYGTPTHKAVSPNANGRLSQGKSSPRGSISPTGRTSPGRQSRRRANEPTELTRDLVYFLELAEHADKGLLTPDMFKPLPGQKNFHSKWLMQGVYHLEGQLRTTGSGRYFVKVINTWNVDYEAGFPYSNEVVYRRNPRFMSHKAAQTTHLVQEMLDAIPSGHGMNLNRSETPPKRNYWEYADDLELDSNTLFTMRGKTAQRDPGLNILFTGKQLRAAMKHLTRRLKVNPSKMQTVWTFFLNPFPNLLSEFLKTKQNLSHAMPIILFHIRGSTGSSPRFLLHFVVLTWLLLAFICAMTYLHHIPGLDLQSKGPLHYLEPAIALLYYAWGSFYFALECASEVRQLPANIPFELAYTKAEISMEVLHVTRLEDGQTIQVTAMGFLQMCCRLHEKKKEEDEEEEEEEEDDDDDDEDPFALGRETLQKFWCQSKLSHSIPFVDDADTNAADVIYRYEVQDDTETPEEWDNTNDVYMQGMQTQIDLGRPTRKGNLICIVLALLNATIGVIHRGAIGYMMFGHSWLDVAITLACCWCTFTGSYLVYHRLFCTAFQWYTMLLFFEQLGKCLTINTAMWIHLPCYVDLRHEGNLEAWYSAREYLNLWCTSCLFGPMHQTIVASALGISAMISVNALSQYFSDSTNIEWDNPGGIFSLLNMLVLCALLFLSLVALEKINAESKKLVRVLDEVGIEVSKISTVAQSARERLDAEKAQMQDDEEDDPASAELQRKLKEAEEQSLWSDDPALQSMQRRLRLVQTFQKQLASQIRDVTVNTRAILNRQEIQTEYQFLQTIMAELRDASDSRKIYGFVIDRVALTRIFGGVAVVFYLILKETADSLLAAYAPANMVG